MPRPTARHHRKAGIRSKRTFSRRTTRSKRAERKRKISAVFVPRREMLPADGAPTVLEVVEIDVGRPFEDEPETGGYDAGPEEEAQAE